MKFYLGTHEVSWLGTAGVRLFVSAVRLRRQKTWPRAKAPWALDSGGFTELERYGEWRTDAMTYSTEVRRWWNEIGNMDWAAPQDWMCEPIMIDGGWLSGTPNVGPYVPGTHLSVAEHQRRTVANYLLLKQLAPDLPWIPVLQGYRYEEYLDCLGMYYAAGVRLHLHNIVGLGSVCRRQETGLVEELTQYLFNRHGLGLHGFGLKVEGLERSARWLKSADSMAWSKAARGRRMLPTCEHSSCTGCLPWALKWREKALRAAERGVRRWPEPKLFA